MLQTEDRREVFGRVWPLRCRRLDGSPMPIVVELSLSIETEAVVRVRGREPKCRLAKVL